MPTHLSNPPNQGTRLLRVLIVDDFDRVRSELRSLLDLTDSVTVVGEAVDGQEAVHLAGELVPDVILMDLEMPGVNGFDATRQIKSRTPAPHVVILSVHARLVEQEAAHAAGADEFIVKGADYKALIDAILGRNENLYSVNGKGEKS